MNNPANILVIDDSPTVRRMIELILNQHGHRVHTAEDGAAGFDVARKVKPDLILVDYVMPNMNGAQFCELVRRDATLSKTKIILISSKGQVIGEAFEKRFGVVDYFTKPFAPEDLIAKIDTVLPRQEGNDQAASPAPDQERAPDVQIGMQQAIEHFDRVIREYFHARFPVQLKALIVDTLREQGVTPPGPIAFTGQIGAMGLPDVLNMLASTAATGRLSVMSRDAFAEIFVESGLFVFASLSRNEGRHQFLTDVLAEQFDVHIEREILLEITCESQDTGRSVGQIIVERELVNKEILSKALSQQARDALNSALEISDGEFSFDSQPLPDTLDDVDYRLPMMAVLMDGLRSLDEKQLAATRLPEDDVVLTRFIANETSNDLRLEGRELRALMSIDGKKTLAQIAVELGFSVLEFKQICGPLIQSGMVRVPQQARRATASDTPNTQHSSPHPASGSTPDSDR